MHRLLPLLILTLACGEDKEGPPSKDLDSAAAVPTWHQDVAPLLARSCGGCHLEGGAAFALDSYSAAAGMASPIASAVAERRMPPWGAYETEDCSPPLPFQDDMRLSDEEIATIVAWAEGGAPEGDSASAAPVERPDRPGLSRVDAELFPLTDYVTSGDDDEFICFVIDPELDSPRWLQGVDIAPGNDSVVHHALVYIDHSGEALEKGGATGQYPCFGGIGLGDIELIGAWAPGARAFEVPAGAGIPLSPGSPLVMQIHYHPSGEVAEPDLTGVQLQWTDAEPELAATLALIGNSSSGRDGLEPGPNDRTERPEFRIPAGVADHQETMSLVIPFNIGGPFTVFLAGTHMHYLGANMRFWVDYAAEREDGRTTDCLVETPAYDFNWQRSYAYEGELDEMPVVKGGDTLWAQCSYNNTMDHPGTRAALEDAGLSEPVDVYLGEETLDEMCLGVLGVVYTP
jgi:hypothetical protein